MRARNAADAAQRGRLRDDGAIQLVPLTAKHRLRPLTGRHNVLNALAAAALALGCGVGLDDIAAGLRGAEPVAGRLIRHRLDTGAWLIDDTYNANPGSLNAAIDTLAAMPGEHWLVLGDMRDSAAMRRRCMPKRTTRRAAGIARCTHSAS